MAIEDQPLARLQWGPRGDLRPNDYNPNTVPPLELRLLETSIVEDGWTQPIVATDAGDIVDGFHRWTIAERPRVAALTEGAVPFVIVSGMDQARRMAATIRHNRARGVHGVKPMAAIVRDMVTGLGLSIEQVMVVLGMQREEVERLLDLRGQPERVGGDGQVGEAWVPEANPEAR